MQNTETKKASRKYFVSYAHKTEKLALDLLDKLEDQMGLSKHFTFKKWIDHNIVIGEKWDDQIQQQIQECDFGLLLLSATFFNRWYIVKNELIHFIDNSGKKIEILKPIVPVGLESFSMNGDLKGLEQTQIYRYQKAAGENHKFYNELSRNKIDFAKDLSQKIEGKFK